MKMTARRRRRGRRTSLAANFRKTSWRARSHRSIFLLALYPLSSGRRATVPPTRTIVVAWDFFECFEVFHPQRNYTVNII